MPVMPTDLIRYDLLCQDALRSVVARVLRDAAKTGLPGDHHFYITFDTQAPGVRLSNRMRAKYPEKMTVVLQHQFWDLAVTEHTFEVGLSFGGIPERLLIPFDSLVEFIDPSVQFALQFEPATQAEPAVDAANASVEPEPEAFKKPAKTKSGGSARGAGTEPNEITPDAKVAEAAPGNPPPSNGGAQIVSLDTFRKK